MVLEVAQKYDSEINQIMREFDPEPWVKTDVLRASVAALFTDNRDKSARQLQEMATGLYDGRSLHNRGDLVKYIRDNFDECVDPLLMAAAIYNTWKGGKAGFAFLPAPHECDLEEYQWNVDFLLDAFRWEVDRVIPHDHFDPSRILEPGDLEFYESLPDRLTVYRGAADVSPEMVAAGLCWSTDRKWAEWFACRASRTNRGSPVLVSARIQKNEICLVFTEECEVVASVSAWRQLKCRHRLQRPDVTWKMTVPKQCNAPCS